jgi:hypothetical protein
MISSKMMWLIYQSQLVPFTLLNKHVNMVMANHVFLFGRNLTDNLSAFELLLFSQMYSTDNILYYALYFLYNDVCMLFLLTHSPCLNLVLCASNFMMLHR